VSWRFGHDAEAEQVAILIRGATPTHFHLTAYNTTDHPVTATMTGWNVAAGEWKASTGAGTFHFEKSAGVPVTFAPHQTIEADYDLVKAGPPTETRADLGIGPEDVARKGRALSVTVHSLGALDAPAGTLVVEDASGKVVAQAATPPLAAPRDLKPKTAVVKLTLPAGFDAKGARVRVSLGQAEVTQLNNEVVLP
jgi:hypothetical protein